LKERGKRFLRRTSSLLNALWDIEVSSLSDSPFTLSLKMGEEILERGEAPL
jgi:hypothetical protein